LVIFHEFNKTPNLTLQCPALFVNSQVKQTTNNKCYKSFAGVHSHTLTHTRTHTHTH